MNLHKEVALDPFLFLTLNFLALTIQAKPFETTGKSSLTALRWPRNDFEAVNFLIRYGYLDAGYAFQDGVSNANHILQTAIKNFQKFSGTKETGNFDPDTYQMMRRKRCGVPDVLDVDGLSHEPSVPDVLDGETQPAFPKLHRQKRYALHGSKWHHMNLTYRISSYMSHLTKKEAEDMVSKAFSMWSDVSLLTFIKKDNGSVDISIEFVAGSHGDGIPFDGEDGVLAHAFFPHDNSPGIHGDAHFDVAEKWVVKSGSADGINILCVALHEFGHSLGLLHSRKPKSIMRPYSVQCDNVSLSEDDINAIQAIYGHPKKSTLPSTVSSAPTRDNSKTTSGSLPPRVPPETSTSPTTTQRYCQGKLDAITVAADHNAYGFKGELVYRFNQINTDFSFPKPINEIFSGGPPRVDAAVTFSQTRKNSITVSTYLFQGRYVWRFKLHLDTFQLSRGYPRLWNREWNINRAKIDAAFTLGEQSRLYLLIGKRIWIMKIKGKRIIPVKSHPKQKYRIFRQMPHIDAAFQWINRHTYFFSGNQYYRLSFPPRGRGTLMGPRQTAHWWFGCNMPAYVKKPMDDDKFVDYDYDK